MIGKKIYKFAKKLWPINRSLTGEGVRQTLKLIKKELPELKLLKIIINVEKISRVGKHRSCA